MVANGMVGRPTYGTLTSQISADRKALEFEVFRDWGIEMKNYAHLMTMLPLSVNNIKH